MGQEQSRLKITFVLYDEAADGVAVMHDDEVVWRESTFDKLDQYFRHHPPPADPVTIETAEVLGG